MLKEIQPTVNAKCLFFQLISIIFLVMAKVVSVGLACLVEKLIEVLSLGKHKWGDNGILQTKMEESLSDCKPKTGEQCHIAWEYVSVVFWVHWVPISETEKPILLNLCCVI